jgi:plasmid stabilization system protein ParE
MILKPRKTRRTRKRRKRFEQKGAKVAKKSEIFAFFACFCEKNRIIYLIKPDQIDVLAVIHGARQLPWTEEE